MIFALGAFDGFHYGHQSLLKKAQQRACENNTGWGVITFEGHPRSIFSCGKFKLLFNSQEREMLSSAMGIEHFEKIVFTREFASLSAREFTAYLSDNFDVDGLVVGENFRFAQGRSGTPEILRNLCSERLWTFDVMPSYRVNGVVVSSTGIREAVMTGDMRTAAEHLSYPYFMSGEVSHGDARGRNIGFPTANVRIMDNKVYPPDGVYSALCFLNGKWRHAAMNIGCNPTFGDDMERRCEAHILDFSEDIYGSGIFLFIISRIRDEKKFTDSKLLTEQISNDILQCREQCDDYLLKNIDNLKKFEIGEFKKPEIVF